MLDCVLDIMLLRNNYLRRSPPPLLGEPLACLRGDLLLGAGGAVASAAEVAS